MDNALQMKQIVANEFDLYDFGDFGAIEATGAVTRGNYNSTNAVALSPNRGKNEIFHVHRNHQEGAMMIESRRRNRATAFPGLQVRLGSSSPGARARSRHERGQAAAEFALVLPLVLTVLIATSLYGIAFNQSSQLTYAADSAAQLLSISRGQTTDPCQTTSQAVYSAAPYLNQSQLLFTIVLDGHSVTSNAAQPSCSGGQQYLVASQNAQVTLTYPCNVKVLGFDPLPNCKLSAQTTALIQ